MRKTKIAVAVLCSAVISLSGCGGSQGTGGSAASGSAAGSSSSSASGATSSTQAASSSQAGPASLSSSGAQASASREGYTDGDPDSMFQDGAGAYIPSFLDGFYGVWVAAEKNEEDAVKIAVALNDIGYDSEVIYSPEFAALNFEPYYCVTAEICHTEKEAQSFLADVKAKGYKNAYVKHTGKRYYTTMLYKNYGNTKYEVSDKKITLKNIGVSETKTWYPGMDANENAYLMNLVIDDTTVFDPSCDMKGFGNYEEGDTPLTWFKKNYELMNKNPDKYMENGPALSGIFEVGIDGNHIEMFFGSYWWD